MKLEKAIRDLQARIDGEFFIKGKDDCADMKLGIEAMKCLQMVRRNYHSSASRLLPGETEE